MKTQLGPISIDLAAALGDDRDRIEVPRSAPVGITHAEILLSQIEAALSRLDHGTYGLCMDCGTEISLPRLEANPVATTCRHCYDDQIAASA